MADPKKRGTIVLGNAPLLHNSNSFSNTNNNNNTSILKSGQLSLFDAHSSLSKWKKKIITLDFQNGTLSIASSKKKDKPSYVISLESCRIEGSHEKKKNSFCVVDKLGTNWTLLASSDEEYDDWFKSIHKVIQQQVAKKNESIIGTQIGEINPNDLEVVENQNVGKGASGVVKKGIWLKSVDVAIKTLNNLPEFISDEEKDSFFREMKLLSELRHPNIVSMYGYCKKNNYIFLVTEFIQGGDLSAWIHDPSKEVTLERKFDIAANISKAMIFLHGKSVIHRDLKPQNILVENWEEGKVKVCDFGLSKVSKPNMEMTANTGGTPRYAAPELDSKNHTNKVDVYSFAMILWEIENRVLPWSHLESVWQIGVEVVSGHRPPVPPTCVFAKLLEKCWAQEPEKRPEFNQIFSELTQLRQSNGKTAQQSPAMVPQSPHKDQLSTTQYINPAQQKQRVAQKTPSQEPTDPGLIYGNATTNSPLALTPEQQVTKAFTQENIPWETFAKAYASAFNSPAKYLAHSLVKDGTVSKTRWDLFLQWFTPITGESVYANATKTSTVGYTTRQIEKILSPEWFHGFLNADEAKDLLQPHPEGAFLFRFSGSPKCYSLSVKHKSNLGFVTHWRITTEKANVDSDPIFKIDDKVYESIDAIVEKHRQVSIEVFQLKNTGQENVKLTSMVSKSNSAAVFSNYASF